MKNIIISSCLFAFTLSPAWAEDQVEVTDMAVAVDIYAEASAEIKPAAPILIAPAVIEAPKLSQQDNATLHLSIIRDEVLAMDEPSFFGGLFEASSELQETLLQDISLFLSVYHDLPITAEAVYLQGQLLKKQGFDEAAAVSWLQTIYEYPTSEAAQSARESLKALIAKDWDKFSANITPIMSDIPDNDIPSRLNALINHLYPLDDKALVKALRLLQIDFLKRFPNNIHADEVQVLMAHNVGAESAESGIFGFKKLLALYPNSAYRTESMLAIADLQRLRLKSYEKAASNYQVLIQEYPDHKLTKNAYESLALTQEKHLKQYPEAIVTYQTIVDRYPEGKSALKALQSMASLQERKTKELSKAVETLRKIAVTFHGFEATDALEDAIKIASKKLKDDKLSFETRAQLVQDYPNSKGAPKALFAMAETAQKKFEDEAQAKSLYQQLIQTYPNHKLAKKAKKNI